jgi:hypothetical protein
MPKDEMKLAFINLCSPNWQQEFLKTGINEYSSTWVEILAKEALEQAEVAIAKMALAPKKEATKHNQEEGELLPKEGFKQMAKTAFYCKMHGSNQRHNTDGCKVVNAKIKRLKGQKPPYNNKNQQDSGNNKKTWTDNKNKCLSATSYTIKQLKEVLCMTCKKAMQDAKTKFYKRVQDKLHALEIRFDNAIQEMQKMNDMEVFVNNPVPSIKRKSDNDLTQVKLEELALSFLD